MIPLDQVLTVERVFVGAFGASKKRVLQTLAERLASAVPGVTELDLFDQLIARERLGSTDWVRALPCPIAALPTSTGPSPLW